MYERSPFKDLNVTVESYPLLVSLLVTVLANSYVIDTHVNGVELALSVKCLVVVVDVLAGTFPITAGGIQLLKHGKFVGCEVRDDLFLAVQCVIPS